jgi:hypothetical protein
MSFDSSSTSLGCHCSQLILPTPSAVPSRNDAQARNHTIECRSEGGGVRIQGLQASRRRTSIGQDDWRHFKGEGHDDGDYRGSMRLSGKLHKLLDPLRDQQKASHFELTMSCVIHIYISLCTNNQGECGYGPNLVVDGSIVNDVKSREDILKALGIQE